VLPKGTNSVELKNSKVLEARNLRKTFGDFVAVEDVSFELRGGECLGLLGPNGAGKTSTIRMVYGFSPMTSGSLDIFGKDMRYHWRTIKYGIGVCQQENTLDPDLTVLQNLEVFASYFDISRKEAGKRAAELLEFMGLEHRLDSKVTELSGGMMRRVVIARALINRPDLLVLDEPTTGLDPQSRHQVWDRLESLRSQGLSILLTTHYMDEAARLCDRLVILDHGRILVEGAPADLVKNHVGRDVVEVRYPGAELRSFVKELGLRHEDLEHHLIIYGDEGDRLFERIGQLYCSENCTLRTATLEDVFLVLTGRELRE
jgi:lipooligosaccharide transport system ATP-binding protein